jgi:hypothetical protein
VITKLEKPDFPFINDNNLSTIIIRVTIDNPFFAVFAFKEHYIKTTDRRRLLTKEVAIMPMKTVLGYQ